MKVTPLQPTEDGYFFAHLDRFYCAQFHENPARTFLAPARRDDWSKRMAREMGGVRIFPGHLDAQTMFEIVGAIESARGEGFERGVQHSQNQIRKALGL